MGVTTEQAETADLVEIGDGRAQVVVAPAIGGAIASFRWHGPEGIIDWMRPTSASALDRGDAGELACFPLAPYSNRIRDSRFDFGGRAIDLEGKRPADPHFEHGHGWRNPWSVVGTTRDRMTLRYVHERDAWPWHFATEQRIGVTDGVLEIRISIENLDDTEMPAGLGLHPYFPATPLTRLDAEVSGMWRTDAEVLPTHHGAVPPGADPNAGLTIGNVELDTVFTGWGRRARITWPERGATLTIEAESPLRNLVLYTPRGSGFFCAEPVSNVTDAFNLANAGIADTGMFVLAPGARRSASVRFVPALI